MNCWLLGTEHSLHKELGKYRLAKGRRRSYIPAWLFALSCVFQISFPSLLIAFAFVPAVLVMEKMSLLSYGLWHFPFTDRSALHQTHLCAFFLFGVLFSSHCESTYMFILENLEKSITLKKTIKHTPCGTSLMQNASGSVSAP